MHCTEEQLFSSLTAYDQGMLFHLIKHFFSPILFFLAVAEESHKMNLYFQLGKPLNFYGK